MAIVYLPLGPLLVIQTLEGLLHGPTCYLIYPPGHSQTLNDAHGPYMTLMDP